VLLAAGVGITPVFSMLLSALEAMPERQIIFIHGSLNEESQAFKKVIDTLASKYSNLNVHYRYSEPTRKDFAASNVDSGFIDAALIEAKVPQRDADYFFCGPQPFMVSIYRELLTWGIPASQVHFEFFGPRQELESPKAQIKCPFDSAGNRV
jgi:nitric oxide dioxygenase